MQHCHNGARGLRQLWTRANTPQRAQATKRPPTWTNLRINYLRTSATCVFGQPQSPPKARARSNLVLVLGSVGCHFGLLRPGTAHVVQRWLYRKLGRTCHLGITWPCPTTPASPHATHVGVLRRTPFPLEPHKLPARCVRLRKANIK
jgi:hypothetical protein